MEDYKQKYEEAIERMKSWVRGEHPECFTEAQKAAEFVFPELKESEDEKIKEVIINVFDISEPDETWGDTDITTKDIIAWLKKQGEQKPVEWNAYDKATLEYIIEDIKELCDNETEEGSIETYNRELNLLQAINKSIKLSSYTNPADWSEEDKKMIRGLIVICDEWTTRHSFYPIENCEIEKLKNWLKSLKPKHLPVLSKDALYQAKKDAYNTALDKIEYHSGEPTFDDGWSAAIDYITKHNIVTLK